MNMVDSVLELRLEIATNGRQFFTVETGGEKEGSICCRRAEIIESKI